MKIAMWANERDRLRISIKPMKKIFPHVHGSQYFEVEYRQLPPFKFRTEYVRDT